MERYQESLPILKALSDETRLRILALLRQGSRSCCQIKEAFDCSQPTISYHMKSLTDCGLVLCRKEGSWCWYSLNPAMWPVIETMLDEMKKQRKPENETI